MDDELQYDQSPGLNRHVYESEWASLEPLMEDSPVEALPDVADLLARLLRDSGYDLDDPVAVAGDDPDVIADYREIRELADQVARGGDIDPGDVGQAIEDLRDLFNRVLDTAEPPG
jgi:hypothetical protein